MKTTLIKLTTVKKRTAYVNPDHIWVVYVDPDVDIHSIIYGSGDNDYIHITEQEFQEKLAQFVYKGEEFQEKLARYVKKGGT